MESRLQSENSQIRTLSMLNIKCRASKNQSLFAVRAFPYAVKSTVIYSYLRRQPKLSPSEF